MVIVAVYVDDIAIAARSDVESTGCTVRSEGHGCAALLPGGEGRSISKHWRGLDWPGDLYKEYPPTELAHQLTPV